MFISGAAVLLSFALGSRAMRFRHHTEVHDRRQEFVGDMAGEQEEMTQNWTRPESSDVRADQEPNWAGVNAQKACVRHFAALRPCGPTCQSGKREKVGSLHCCLCPPLSVWVEMSKSCVCSVGVKNGMTFIKPAHSTRTCPDTIDEHVRLQAQPTQPGSDTRKSYITAPMQMVSLERSFCEARQALDEKSDPSIEKNFVMRLGIAYEGQKFDIVTARDIQLQHIETKLTLDGAPDGVTMHIEHSQIEVLIIDFRFSSPFYSLYGLDIRREWMRFAVQVSGTERVDQILKFGQPLNLNVSLSRIKTSGSRIENKVAKWLRGYIMTKVASSIVAQMFSTIAFQMQDLTVSGPGPLRTAMQGRSPFPFAITLSPCKTGVSNCADIGVKVGRMRAQSETKQVTPALETGGFVTHAASLKADLASKHLTSEMIALVSLDVKMLLETSCQKQNEKLLAVARGDIEEVNAFGGESALNDPVSPPVHSCNRALHGEPGLLRQFASNVGWGVQWAAGKAWGVTTGVSGFLWRNTGGRIAKYLDNTEPDTRDAERPGPERYEVELDVFEIWQQESRLRRNSIQHGIMKRTGPWQYYMASIKSVDVQIDGKLHVAQTTDVATVLEGVIDLSRLKIHSLVYEHFNVKSKAWEPYGYTPFGTEVLTATGSNGLDLILQPTKAHVQVYISSVSGLIWACVRVEDLHLSSSNAGFATNKILSSGLWWYDAKTFLETTLDDMIADVLNQGLEQMGGAVKSANVTLNLNTSGSLVSGRLALGVSADQGGLSNLLAHMQAQPPPPASGGLNKPIGHGWVDLKEQQRKKYENRTDQIPPDSTNEMIAIDPTDFLAPSLDAFTDVSFTGDFNLQHQWVLNLSGRVQIDSNKLLRPILNDYGGFDYGQFRGATQEAIQVVKVRGGKIRRSYQAQIVLQCGALYLLPPSEQKFRLLESDKNTGRWLGRFDLMQIDDPSGNPETLLFHMSNITFPSLAKLRFGLDQDVVNELKARFFNGDGSCFGSSIVSGPALLFMGKYESTLKGKAHRSKFFFCLPQGSSMAKALLWEFDRFAHMRQMMQVGRGIDERAVQAQENLLVSVNQSSAKGQRILQNIKDLKLFLSSEHPQYNRVHAWLPYGWPVKDEGYFNWEARPTESAGRHIIRMCSQQVSSCAKYRMCQGLSIDEDGSCVFLSFREVNKLKMAKSETHTMYKRWRIGSLWNTHTV